jgi:hypothetical protein
MQRHRLFGGILGLVWFAVGMAALWLGFWSTAGALLVAVLGGAGAFLAFWNLVAESRHR